MPVSVLSDDQRYFHVAVGRIRVRADDVHLLDQLVRQLTHSRPVLDRVFEVLLIQPQAMAITLIDTPDWPTV